MSKKSIQKAIKSSKDKIEEIDQKIIIESVGVYQAIDELRNDLNSIQECLDNREFEKASGLGYQDIMSNIVFLQRTLGGLQTVMNKKSGLVSEIAFKSGVGVYEKVEPFINEIMESTH